MRRIYGVISAQEMPPDPKPPTDREAALRNDSDIPVPPMSQKDVDLALAIDDADNAILHKGLAKMGMNGKTLDKLRALDGLATSSGKFVALALEKTHRMYFMQLVGLFEIADEVRERYLTQHKDEAGKLYDPVANDEVRAMYYRNYTEMVKEGGRGYKQVMDGTEALVRMIMSSKSTNGKPVKHAKPAWGSAPQGKT